MQIKPLKIIVFSVLAGCVLLCCAMLYSHYNSKNNQINTAEGMPSNIDNSTGNDSNTVVNNSGNNIDNSSNNATTTNNNGQPEKSEPISQNGNSQTTDTFTESTDNNGSSDNLGTENTYNSASDSINSIIPSSSVKKPDAVKALYLTGWTAGSPDRLDHFIQLAINTEINSYVIDIKDVDGVVGYKSDIPAVKEIDAWISKYNADDVIKTLHENDIYVIGRLVCFKDPVLSSKKPDLAVKNINGGIWKDNFGVSWLDPYNRNSWSYLIDIAKEAVKKGFDEIQFDYIRFPNDGDKKAMVFSSNNEQKYEAVNAFLAYARQELPNVRLSADVFGIICESPEDTEDIGQYLELIGKDIEYISPMVYPSHYAFGQIVNNVTFAKPDFEPYAVVYNSLVKAKNRISQVENYKADIRPYLQGFTASYLRQGNYQTYGAKQIREQIQAVYDAGLTEWIIWDPSCNYPDDAFETIE